MVLFSETRENEKQKRGERGTLFVFFNLPSGHQSWWNLKTVY
jgi:hypothetical protein